MAKIFFPLKQNEEEARVVFPITHITDLAGPGVRPQHTVRVWAMTAHFLRFKI